MAAWMDREDDFWDSIRPVFRLVSAVCGASAIPQNQYRHTASESSSRTTQCKIQMGQVQRASKPAFHTPLVFRRHFATPFQTSRAVIAKVEASKLPGSGTVAVSII